MSGERQPPLRTTLPASFQLVWAARGDASALSLGGRTLDRGESAAMAFWRRGLEPWGGGEFPLGAAEVGLGAFPVLDDVWTLYLWAYREGHDALPPAWEAMCRYTADARQGLAAERIGAERAVQSVYLAIAQEHLVGAVARREEFLLAAFELFDHVVTRIEAGARLLEDDLFEGAVGFDRYLALLAADRALYAEDRARSERAWAVLPASRGATGTERRLPLLLLRRPVARQFKIWARRDAGAPGGGYPLLLVELGEGNITLTADPTSRASVGWLAEGLTRLEREHGGDGVWYDGANHGGTVVAAPRGGTKVPFDAVRKHFRGELRLTPLSVAPSPVGRVAVLGGGVAVLAMAALALGMRMTRPEPVITSPPAASALGATLAPGSAEASREAKLDVPPSSVGARGQPLPVTESAKLSKAKDGPTTLQHYAIVAGACDYEGDKRLDAPCNDARAVRDALIRDYGYKSKNILLLVDKREPGDTVLGKPTAENLKLAVQKFREKFGDDERSTFLFYYSGHGGYLKGAQADYGVLQPSGFFTTYKAQPYENRGWDMQTLLGDIKKGVPARHIGVILDCCYAGWAGAKGDGELDTRVMSLWNERAEVVLTAGTQGQQSWEDDPRAQEWGGHGALTAFLLQGLAVEPDGYAAADKSRDGVVTDEELAGFLKLKVPAAVRTLKHATQTPQFFRIDQGAAKTGQFLFVPQKP